MGQMFRPFSPAEGNGTPFTASRADGTSETGIRGYDPEDGIMVPRPAPTMPKHGHWRITRRTRKGKDVVRIQGIKRTDLRHDGNANRVDGDYVREELRVKRTRRERQLGMLGELYAMGVVSAADLSPKERALICE